MLERETTKLSAFGTAGRMGALGRAMDRLPRRHRTQQGNTEDAMVSDQRVLTIRRQGDP